MKLLILYIICVLSINGLFAESTDKARLVMFDKIGQKEKILTTENISIVYGPKVKTEYVYLNYTQGRSINDYFIELKSIEPLLQDIASFRHSKDSLKQVLQSNMQNEQVSLEIEQQADEPEHKAPKIEANKIIDSLKDANDFNEVDNVFNKIPKIKTLIGAVDYIRKQNSAKINDSKDDLKNIDRQIDSIQYIIDSTKRTGNNSSKILNYLQEIEKLKLAKREIQLLNDQLIINNKLLEKEILARNAEYESLMRLIYIMILIIVLVIVVTGALYYNYYQKKKYNRQLSEINQKLELINKELYQSNLENEKLLSVIKNELNLASNYVTSLLPSTLNTPYIKTDWIFKPSEELGGDAFGYHKIDDNNFAMYLIDVSGHGVGAALHSVQVLNILQNCALPNVNFLKPEEIMNSLNNIFQMDHYGGLYFTMFYAVYNIQEQTLTYAGAGHPPMLLFSNNKLVDLESQNLFIGAIKNLQYSSDTIKISKDDTLFMFSDGAFEIIDNEQRVWTFDEFKDRMVREHSSKNFTLNKIYDENLALSGRNILDDDFSFIKVTFL
ncbi:MAG TPA: SpoIIE family protein phosphatase [Candidatus Kapabacteria bacterium]|nr:SpoIIE family protein phosphatase [Candidatus Kapabacteria bacterium]